MSDALLSARADGAATGWILAIDTSTEHAGLGLADSSHDFARSWDAGRTQTTTVLPAIEALLAEAGVTIGDLAAIAVAVGPGTFTGLRVGVSIAKGLVLAREIPLIGVPTLAIAAAAADEPEVVAVLPAGRGRVVWQRFAPDGADPARNTTVPELVDALAAWPGALVIGELAEAHRQLVAAAHPRARWEHRDPSRLAGLARQRLAEGEVDDPVALEPIYLHGVTVQAPPVQDRLRR
jgi:tRNA threonylcarbamoyladenosine biosynthesis protein TsaB